MRAVSTLTSTRLSTLDSRFQEILRKLAPRKTLRTTVAPQTDRFSAESLRLFYSSVYTVTEESNRMGLRLQGPVLDTFRKGQMTSEGVSLGAIQIPASGQPIILFVEQQTTGGYPKIANIISADLPSVGQLRPRDEIRFELVTPEIARALIREQETLMSQWKHKCTQQHTP
jgi:antagonist of KipI